MHWLLNQENLAHIIVKKENCNNFLSRKMFYIKLLQRRNLQRYLRRHTFTFFLSLLSGTMIYGSGKSEPCTLRKQFVVWPIPIGKILSCSMAFTVVLFPLLVRPKNATFIWSLNRTSEMLETWARKPDTCVREMP